MIVTGAGFLRGLLKRTFERYREPRLTPDPRACKRAGNVVDRRLHYEWAQDDPSNIQGDGS